MIELYAHQRRALEATDGFANVGYFLDMGLGKSYIAAERVKRNGHEVNLVLCQKSMIATWLDVLDAFGIEAHTLADFDGRGTLVVNYDLSFRRDVITATEWGTLVLDESSLLQNEQCKRSKAVLRAIKRQQVVLLSGTVVNGNYEKLWSQCHLLGWNIGRDLFDATYMEWEHVRVDGFYRKKRVGYKNIDRLKAKLRAHGAVFVKTEEVFDLPAQTVTRIACEKSAEYAEFERAGITEAFGREFVGDTVLTRRLRARELCTAAYNAAKIEAFRDLLASTDDRLVVFYNFERELEALRGCADGRPVSVVNGSAKDLMSYEQHADSVTFVQYQAGAFGLNLQLANKMVFASLPDGGAEIFEQAKKRIHRIGQVRPCFYWVLFCEGTIEDGSIEPTLEEKKERIDELFREESNHGA